MAHLALVTGLGCSSNDAPAVRKLGPDATIPLDAAVQLDATIERVNAPVSQTAPDALADVLALPSCATPIEGTGPFAVRVTDSENSVRANLYFPRGRVAGAPVVLDFPSSDRSVGVATLDATLSVASISSHDWCGNGVTAALVGPSDGLRAQVDANTDMFPDDTIQITTRSAVMCPAGSIPAATLKLAGLSPALPGVPIAFVATTPIDRASASCVADSGVDGASASVEYDGLTLSITPPPGRFFAPGTHPLDLRGVTDVIGRPYGGAPSSLEILKPAEAIGQDAGSLQSAVALLAGGEVSAESGTITISAQMNGMTFGAVIGLGQSATASKARVVHRFVCSYASTYFGGRVTVVSSDGSYASVEGGCSNDPTDSTVALPGPGPHYLVVNNLSEPLRMCTTPPPPVANAWELSEVALLP